MKHHVILGAGVSGLALAWKLKDNSRVTIVEKCHRPGGWLRTIHQDGFLFEQGPRSCRPKGAGINTLELIEALGLQDQVITGKTLKRYLYVDGQMRTIPSGPFSVLFSPLTRGILPAIWNDLRTPGNVSQDESIYEFFSRRFSSQVAEKLIDPMTLGIYAGDIRKLSLKSCFPFLHQLERDHGSIIKGLFTRKKEKKVGSPFIREIQKASLFSFKGGMETLSNELAKRLESDLMLGTGAASLAFHNDFVEVGLSNGTKIHADHVHSTLPARELAQILPDPKLKQIPYVSVAVVNLGYRKQILEKHGFGYLIPSNQREPILGVVFDSCIFPQQNKSADETRITVMMHLRGTNEELKNTALAAVSKHLNIDDYPDAISVFQAKDAIPQYHVGHTELVNSILPPSHRLSILGSSFNGVSVNDCIKGR